MPPAQVLACWALMTLGSVGDAVTAANGSLAGSSSSAQQPREGVLWGMRKGKILPTFPG